MGIISDQRLELTIEAQLNSYDGFVTPKFDPATLEDLNEQMEDHAMENEMPDIFSYIWCDSNKTERHYTSICSSKASINLRMNLKNFSEEVKFEHFIHQKHFEG